MSTKPIAHKIDSVTKGTIPVYEYQLLETATNKFSESNVLSRGGRGCLYKACLDEKSSVTVKRLDGGERDQDDVQKCVRSPDWTRANSGEYCCLVARATGDAIGTTNEVILLGNYADSVKAFGRCL